MTNNKLPKILFIGAGFIGSAVIAKLRQAGYQLELYTKETGQDILDEQALEPAIKRNDYCVQMAAVADLNKFEQDPMTGMKVNLWGTTLCAYYCSKHKKRLFNISTCCVYGNTKDLPSNENSTCNPSEIYAEAKLAGEHVVKAFHKSYGLEYLILRIATAYGPGMRKELAVAIFFDKILKGEPITIHGTGNQTRTFTYIEDEAEGIFSAIKHAEVVNETINISSEEEKSVNNLVRLIMKITGKQVPINYGADRKGQTFRESIDASKAKRLLGWEAKYSLEEGLKKTWEWIKNS